MNKLIFYILKKLGYRICFTAKSQISCAHIQIDNFAQTKHEDANSIADRMHTNDEHVVYINRFGYGFCTRDKKIAFVR